IFELGQIAFEQEDYSLAKQIFKEVQAKTNQPVLFYRSAQYLLKLLQFNPENSAEAISQAYQDFFTAEKISALTHAIYLDWAKFIANQLQNPVRAINLLDKVNSSQIRPSQMASTKLLKGDLLRLEGQFNQALLLYAQVEKLVPNSDEAREAKFKTAQTSYFQGDFDWALTQLDVLKQSVSQRMANDALELALHIRENSYLDSTQTDLKRVAKADLLRSQQRYHKAINILQKVLESYKDVAIVDEALYRLALNFESLSNFEAAAEAYNQLVTDYPESILADNASFALGLIYRDQLNATEKAKSKFEQIIFKHPDSIYFVEAREIFRTLRGDKIE
ncbi:MAG: tetratricopeptide repeat protein, partial [Psychroflexus salarius]